MIQLFNTFGRSKQPVESIGPGPVKSFPADPRSLPTRTWG